VSTSLSVIGDIGKKTYNALMVDDDDEQRSPTEARKVIITVCLPSPPVCH